MTDPSVTPQNEEVRRQEPSKRRYAIESWLALRLRLAEHGFLADRNSLRNDAPTGLREPHRVASVLARRAEENESSLDDLELRIFEVVQSEIVSRLAETRSPTVVEIAATEPKPTTKSEAPGISPSDEYKATYDNWRFLVGSRFVILGTFFTTFGGIAFLTKELLTETSRKNFGTSATLAAYASMVGGWIVARQLHRIEYRFRSLYTVCIRRTKQLEGATRLATELDRAPIGLNSNDKNFPNPYWLNEATKSGAHSRAIDVLFNMTYVAWTLLILSTTVGVLIHNI